MNNIWVSLLIKCCLQSASCLYICEWIVNYRHVSFLNRIMMNIWQGDCYHTIFWILIQANVVTNMHRTQLIKTCCHRSFRTFIIIFCYDFCIPGCCTFLNCLLLKYVLSYHTKFCCRIKQQPISSSSTFLNCLLLKYVLSYHTKFCCRIKQQPISSSSKCWVLMYQVTNMSYKDIP